MAGCKKNIAVLVLFLFIAGFQVCQAFTLKPVFSSREDDGIRRSREYPNAEAEAYQFAYSVSCYVPIAKIASRSVGSPGTELEFAL